MVRSFSSACPSPLASVRDSIPPVRACAPTDDRSRCRSPRVFLATFVNYAMSHWTRKAYTNVKVQMMAAGVDPLVLASMDSSFMFTYAGGSFITGMLGDRFSPTFIVGLGLAGSSLCLLLITMGVSTGIPLLGISAFWFAGTQFLHGFFQATGGPVNTAIMGNWFPAKGRGLIFGLWTCHQYGECLATLSPVPCPLFPVPCPRPPPSQDQADPSPTRRSTLNSLT